MTQLTSKQLRRAANIQDKIESLQKKLGDLLGNGTVTNGSSTAKPPTKRRKMSAASRAKIAAAARARWARVKAAKKK